MNLNQKIAQKKSLNNGMSVKCFEVKQAAVVDESKRIVEVKFASFDNVDSDRDLLVKGCFAKSIQERGPESETNRKIAFLWQHDLKDPIGKILEIREEEEGAYARIQLSNFNAVPNAKRAYYQLTEGDIDQFSFGFEYVWDKVQYDEGKDAFIVKEVKLHEISVVTFGANEMTQFIGTINNEESIKNYIKELSVKEKDTFDKLRQYINSLEAEPAKPLTSKECLFGKLANI